MKHTAAVLLLALANKEINEKNINEVLNSVGIKANQNVVKLLVQACKGKTTEQLIKEGAEKLKVKPIEDTNTTEEKPIDKKKKKQIINKIREIEEAGNKVYHKSREEEEEDLAFGGLF